MTADQMVNYINSRLNTNVKKTLVNGVTDSTEGLTLTPIGEKYVREKYNKKGDEGYSEFWKSDDSNYLIKE